MFKELSSMLEVGDALVINVVALKGGLLGLTILPQGEFKNPGLGAGMKLEATPQELDDDLAGLLTTYVAKRVSLREQVEAAGVVLDAARAQVTAGVAKATQKPPARRVAGTAGTPAPANAGSGDEGGGDDDETGTGGPGAAAAAVGAGGDAAGDGKTDVVIW